ETAFTLAKINVLNKRETDAFMKALLAERTDLAGLPFAMGDSCRTKGERTRQFAIAVNTVRQAQGQVSAVPTTGSFNVPFSGPPGAGGSTFAPVNPGGTSGPGTGSGPQAPQPPQPTQPAQTTVTAPVTALAVAELVEVAQAPASPTEAAAFWQRY